MQSASFKHYWFVGRGLEGAFKYISRARSYILYFKLEYFILQYCIVSRQTISKSTCSVGGAVSFDRCFAVHEGAIAIPTSVSQVLTDKEASIDLSTEYFLSSQEGFVLQVSRFCWTG